MDLTESYKTALPEAVRERYELRETRNAAAILASIHPGEFGEIVSILSDFSLSGTDLINPGGSESQLAARLNKAFRDLGWREGRHDTHVTSILRVMPHRPAGETQPTEIETNVISEGYRVDNVKNRVALDVEWNAKDGNLDRDIGAYRSLYDAGIIDVAVLITRTQDDLRTLAVRLATEAGVPGAAKRLGTTTTTNLAKLLPRMTRGDGGGCPILAIAITARCLAGQ